MNTNELDDIVLFATNAKEIANVLNITDEIDVSKLSLVDRHGDGQQFMDYFDDKAIVRKSPVGLEGQFMESWKDMRKQQGMTIDSSYTNPDIYSPSSTKQ